MSKWKMPSAQELFDNACLGVIGQGYEMSCDQLGQSVVAMSDSVRDPIGWSIDDSLVYFTEKVTK